MKIRTLTHSDLATLLLLYQHLHEQDEPLPSMDEVEKVWKEILANPRMQVLGGFVDGTLVTSCTLAIIPNLTRGCRPYGIMENVVTDTLQRKRGFGSELLRYALEYAWAKNCYKVMLLTGRKDENVFRFYESAGFSRNGKQAFLARAPAL